MVKKIEDYLKLPYTIELIPDPDGGYGVMVKELPGCISQGDTPEEAIEMIRDAMAGWFEIALEDGMPIPEPRPLASYSGKFVVRVPKSLHRQLVEEAEVEKVSLNQYINTALAAAVEGQAVDNKSLQGEDKHTTASVPAAWPGISEMAARVLSKAGLYGEANEMDEKLFAGWLESVRYQVERDCANEYYQEAIRTLEQALVRLRQCEAQSPFLRSLAELFVSQINLIEKLGEMQKAVVHQAIRVNYEARKQEVFRVSADIEDIPADTPSRYKTIREKHAPEWQKETLDLLFAKRE